MKPDQLHDLWASPDNTRLTSKQFSFRLPVHIAAKVAALCEIYPQKTRTQIVADLLTTALDELEKNLPEAIGYAQPPEDQYVDKQIAEHEGREYEEYFHLGGARGRFRNVANKHFAEIEKELGNEKPEPLFHDIFVTESQFAKSKK